MSITAHLNGQPRKQLSEQLDRLDGILDVLDEGLTGAVADAMKEGCRMALKESLLELFSNPELIATFRNVLQNATPTPVKPTWKTRLRDRLKQAASTVIASVRRCGQRLFGRVRNTVSTVVESVKTIDEQIRVIKRRTQSLLQAMGLLCHVKQLTLISAGAGAVAALATYLAPHELAALAGGVGGATTAAGVQLGIGARSFVRKFQVLTN